MLFFSSLSAFLTENSSNGFKLRYVVAYSEVIGQRDFYVAEQNDSKRIQLGLQCVHFTTV